jgi:hypothetical protein
MGVYGEKGHGEKPLWATNGGHGHDVDQFAAVREANHGYLPHGQVEKLPSLEL